MRDFVKGEAGCIIGSLCFLIRWNVLYYTDGKRGAAVILLLLAAVISGGTGTARILIGLFRKDPTLRITNRKVPSVFTIMGAGAGVFILILIVYNKILQELPSMEGILSILWAVVHLCMISQMYKADACGQLPGAGMAVVVASASAAELACRFYYPDMLVMEGYIFGMLGPIMAAAVMCVIMSFCMFYEFIT